MSADHWATCLRCVRRATVERDTQLKAIDDNMAELYGTMPFREFAEKAADAAEKQAELRESVKDNDNRFRTFREDYEIGMQDQWGDGTGRVYVGYKGKCTKCGWGVEFSDYTPVPGLEDPA